MRFNLPQSQRLFALVDVAKYYQIPLADVEVAVVASGAKPVQEFRGVYLFDGYSVDRITVELKSHKLIPQNSANV